jgi:SAM-dependent methyltransferase
VRLRWNAGVNHRDYTELLRDTRTVSPADLAARPHATALGLTDVLGKLVSPDSGDVLRADASRGMLSDGTNSYPMRGELPLLIPARLQPHFTDRVSVPFATTHDAFMQYFLLASIKQSGEINAAPDDTHFQRHLFRASEFLRETRGLLLDVGCDDPLIGASLLPAGTQYIGLDPFCMRAAPFRLIGVGEYLPFRDGSVDAVLFNTSLDHILDWRRALEEAHRVLAPGGTLYLFTLVWTERAGLIGDAVHFHHFRDYEIFGALDGFEMTAARRYDYKGATHRHGLYLRATKRGG